MRTVCGGTRRSVRELSIHNLGVSRAPLKRQEYQGNNLFTSAATNQRCCPKGSPCFHGKLMSDFQKVTGDRVAVKVGVV